LRRDEKQYRNPFEDTPALICTHDLSGVLLTVNRAAARSLGYASGELLRRNMGEFFSPKAGERLDTYLAELRVGSSASGFMRWRSKHGETRVWQYASTQRKKGAKAPSVRLIAHDVTDVLAAQKTLRETEERFRIAARAGKMYAYEWDVVNDVVVRSRECIDVLGSSVPTRGTRRELTSAVYPEDRCQLDKVVLTPENPTGRVRYRVVRPDGSLLWVEKTARAFFDKEGKMLRVVGMVADINDRMEAEQKLLASEERYRRIVETIYEGIWLLDSSFHTSFVNRQMASILGYEPKEMLGRDVLDFYFPEDVERKRHMLARRQEGLGERFDERLRRKDGGEVWVRMVANPVYTDSGDFDGEMAIVTDITEQRFADEARRESEQRFQLVANSAPVMIWMSDTDKLYNFFNKSWLEFTGRCVEQELGCGWTSGVHPEDLEQCLGIYREAFDAQEAFEMEYRLRRFDGEYRWIADYGVPRFGPNGSFSGYIGSCIDITERKLSEERLRDMSGRLIAAHEEERTRIARELHDDFSQRLTLLSIGLEQCSQELPRSSSAVRRQLESLTKLTSELATDIHNMSHRLHSSALNSLGLVPAISGFCKEFSKQHNLRIKFVHDRIPGEMPRDLTLCLFRVAQEALRNVLKHSGAQDAEVELTGHGDRIDLSVSDTGVGISAEAVGGARGLGLISMRERLRLVGGQLVIESQQSRSGTRVLARVPMPTRHTLPFGDVQAQRAGR